MFEERSHLDGVDQTFPPSVVNNPASWLHTPPAQMPWALPMANQPTVMRFTGDGCGGRLPFNSSSFHFPMESPFLPKKRKSLDSGFDLDVCRPPAKQLITEEKMAANLNGLHISNNYTAHDFGASDTTTMATGTEQKEFTENLPSLVLCEELRKLTAEPVIPPSLINKIERPSTAIVLWQPPGGILSEQLKFAVQRATGNENRNSNEMDTTNKEDDPKPSTSGLSKVPTIDNPPITSNNNIWGNLGINRNSFGAMNLGEPSMLTSPIDVKSDDTLMDL